MLGQQYANPEIGPPQYQANAEPAQGGAYYYPIAANNYYGQNQPAEQQYVLPEGSSTQLTCLYANGISGGCSGAGSVSGFSYGGDQYCYCYSVGSGSSVSYFGGCDDGLTNCVGGTFSNVNYNGMCCSTANCNVSATSAVHYSLALLQLLACVSLLSVRLLY